MRRSSYKSKSPNVLFNDTTVTTLSQESFLLNKHNKIRFIASLSIKLKKAGIKVVQADGDADIVLVNYVLKINESSTPVTLVAEDTDLLVLLLHYHTKNAIFMLRPGKSGKPHRVTDIGDMQNKIGDMT